MVMDAKDVKKLVKILEKLEVKVAKESDILMEVTNGLEETIALLKGTEEESV